MSTVCILLTFTKRKMDLGKPFFISSMRNVSLEHEIDIVSYRIRLCGVWTQTLRFCSHTWVIKCTILLLVLSGTLRLKIIRNFLIIPEFIQSVSANVTTSLRYVALCHPNPVCLSVCDLHAAYSEVTMEDE